MTQLDEVLADSPLLAWPLDETSGTTAADASGNSHTGTYSGTYAFGAAVGPVPATDLISGAMIQSGAIAFNAPCSIEVWFNRTAFQAGQTANINSLIGDLFSVSNGIQLRWDGDNDLLNAYVANGGGYSLFTITTPRNTDLHIVLTIDSGGVLCIYLNGELTLTNTVVFWGFGGNWRVGRSDDGRFMIGKVGLAAIYPTALSAERVHAHYIGESPAPPEVASAHLTIHGGTLVAIPPSAGTIFTASWHVIGGTLTALIPFDRTVRMAGPVTNAMAGAPMVAVEGVIPPRLRASLHRRPNIAAELAELTGSFGRQWQDELNQAGSAEMTIANEDPQATLVGDGDIVRFEDDGFAVFAWIVREIERTQIANGEEHDQVTRFSGVGLLAILAEAVVYPSNGLEMKPIEEDRLFSWQSNDYDDTWWERAPIYPVEDGYQPGVENENVIGLGPGTGMRAGVTEWPMPGCPRLTAPGATYWLAPGGTCYLRRLLYIGPDDPTRTLIIYVVADDECTVYFDGQYQTETSDWGNSNSDLEFFEVEVSPGWHVLAAEVRNSEDGPFYSEMFNEWINPWSFMCAGYRMNEITGEIEGSPLFWTDADNWKIVAYPPGPPGWTPGAVMIRALLEAQFSRGGLPGVHVSFTGQVDSAGNPWPSVTDISTKVGTDYLTFFQELCETYIDMWMEPGTFTLHAWVKGQRRSVNQPVGAPAYALHPVTDPHDPMSGNLGGLTFKRVY